LGSTVAQGSTQIQKYSHGATIGKSL